LYAPLTVAAGSAITYKFPVNIPSLLRFARATGLTLSLASLFVFFSPTPGLADETNRPSHNYSKWEPAISAYEQADRTNPPPRNALLFIGSSTIVRWKSLAQDFPDQKVINRGFGGSEIGDSTHFADRIVFPYQPRKIFLRAGGNDLFAGKSVPEVFSDYQDRVYWSEPKHCAMESGGQRKGPKRVGFQLYEKAFLFNLH
jgi:hypothetical protein